MNNSMFEIGGDDSVNEGIKANIPKLSNVQVKKPKNLEFLIQGIFISTLEPKKVTEIDLKSKNYT
jgi:hypothetical protein